MELAVQKGMSKTMASKQFGVPKTSLIRKVTGNGSTSRKMGPQTVLSQEEELYIEHWLLAMAKKGFPVHRSNLLDTVQKIITDSGRETCFQNNRPGRTWFKKFLTRHPRIKEKHAESLTKARASVTRSNIQKWFAEVKTYLEENGYSSIMKDPSRIFNADETGFLLCPKSGKVLGPAKCREDFYEQTGNNEKQQITVMGMFSADGKYVPPMVIYPYKKIPRDIALSVPKNFALGKSDTGWMNSQVFYEYIANHFCEYLALQNVTLPIILFIDGHRSHLTMETSELCDKNGIILTALLPNTTHILQPADVGVFRPLKSGWRSVVRKWKFENFPKEITRQTFGPLLAEVFENYATGNVIKSGFQACGLFPFNADNVDYSKCIKNRLLEDVSSSKSNDKNTDTKVGLKVLEENVDSDLLQSFKSNDTEEWQGQIESAHLFSVWRKIKNKCMPTALSVTEIAISQARNFDTLSTTRNSQPLLEEDIDIESTEVSIASTSNQISIEEATRPEIVHTPVRSVQPKSVLLTYSSKKADGYIVSTPFRNCLTFPKTPEKRKAKTRKEIFPVVVSSAKYRQYYKAQEQKKKTSYKCKHRVVNSKGTTSKQNNGSTVPVSSESEDSVDNEMSLIGESDTESEKDAESAVMPIVSEGSYVIVRYEGEYFPGIVTGTKEEENGAEIKVMSMSGKYWKWPEKEDKLWYPPEDIVVLISTPALVSNRGLYCIPEIVKYQKISCA